MATRTRAFGAGNRESHDASDFYARFGTPALSDDETVNPCAIPDTIVHGDARDMIDLSDSCVALVVTSPPYFAGKEYEQALGEGHIPSSYVDFLVMLRDVFSECRRVLEPGGRIAVNVANLGRKPYRSLAADVIRILQDDLGLLLRGEIVWQKAKGATGSIAVGSYLSAANPVLRDVTVDVWEMRPEHARRVGHPAPFPVELPERLIRLYTYVGDVVLDPFMGSGSTAVAAVRNDRRYVGYETDPEYVVLAEKRVVNECGVPD